MAFISHNGVLCRDMWPANAARLPNDYESVETLPKSRILPDTYEGICERVVVEGSVASDVRVLTLHPDLEGRTRLSVRLQGIVGDVQLRARGDWNGDADQAVKAMQSITLVNEGCKEAFAHQRNAMRNLEELILTVLRQRGPGGRNSVVQKGSIVMQRRAFAKVGNGTSRLTLSQADDDEELARVSHLWVVDHVIKASILHPNGTVAKVHPVAIRRGDLVDVAVTVEVVSMRARGGRRAVVFLSPNHVVRLKSAIELKASGVLAPQSTAGQTTGQGLTTTQPLIDNGLDGLHSNLLQQIVPAKASRAIRPESSTGKPSDEDTPMLELLSDMGSDAETRSEAEKGLDGAQEDSVIAMSEN